MKPTRRRPAEVFVSYSRNDAELVTPIVALIRTTRRLVFQDLDSLRAGERWQPQIEAAVRAARLVVVFWCQHARSSTFVVEEYQRAISWDKDVVPVLLDRTPLPEDLGQFQAIDFRGLAARLHPAPGASAESASRDARVPPPFDAARRLPSLLRQRWPTLVAGLVLGVGVLLLLLSVLARPMTAPPPPGPSPAPSPPDTIAPAPRRAPVLVLGAAASVVAVIAITMLVRRRRRAARARTMRERYFSPAVLADLDAADRMAHELEKELLRRATSGPAP